MRYSTTTHKIVAIVSFFLLSSVQFFLLYNTYEFKDDHFYIEEKSVISSDYSIAVRNDKVMPGGANIIDSFINPHMHQLEDLYLHNPGAFDTLTQKILDSAFAALRRANNVGDLIRNIIKKNHLRENLEYAVLIEHMAITFGKDNYITIYQKGHTYPLIDPDIQTRSGIRIGGTLQKPRANNQASGIFVSSPMPYSYRMGFGLYVDIENRWLSIVKLMMPTFLLSAFSVLSVVFLFFITFRNWMKQKKLSEMKSDFINSITHEFHTPLSAIIVANKTMQNEKIISSPASLRPLTEVIQRQSLRLQTLISQVLDITTLNRISLNKEEYALHALLDEILLDYRLKLSGTNVQFALQKDAGEDIVFLDRFWFTTILQNIFDNAIKYNNKEEKKIAVTTFHDKKAIHITVHDNGMGMTEDIRRQVFDKFYRYSGPETTTVKGLGLGLFYVKTAVDAHGWDIDIESYPGEGSTFIISIPY